jgi:hypothetical protein
LDVPDETIQQVTNIIKNFFGIGKDRKSN